MIKREKEVLLILSLRFWPGLPVRKMKRPNLAMSRLAKVQMLETRKSQVKAK